MIARAAHIPMLEPADSQECHDYIQRAFELSERYDTPVFLRLTTRLAHQRSPVEMGERAELPVREYKKDFMKYVMMPGMARKRHLVVEAREQRMEDEAACLGLNRVEMRGTALGVVCAGVVYQYVREALPEASILKLGLSYPMDRAAVRDFAARVDKLVVIEELEGIFEQEIAAMGIAVTGKCYTGRQGELSVQRIREAERGKIYDEYVEKENEILTAIVQRVEPKAVYVELGLTEGIMESSEFMPGEEYRVNDHIKVYVLRVQRTRGDAQRTPQVYVSRIHPGLVKRLFEMEVPEIANGIVQIKSIAREAGSRTKMAVYSSELMIDPVGACVGPRGSRVEKVISELRNEKIDIIKWSPDPAEFVANALNPAHVVSVFISDAEKICRVVVPDSQLSLAIGKEGQNARLAAKLTGWKIDIKSETQFAEQLREQGLTMEEAMGGEAPAQQDVDFADDYYPQQDQDAGYEQ